MSIRCVWKKKKYKYITKGKNFSFVFLYTKIQLGKKNNNNNNSTSSLELLLLKSYFFLIFSHPCQIPSDQELRYRQTCFSGCFDFSFYRRRHSKNETSLCNWIFPFWKCAAFNLQLMTPALSAHLDSLSENLNNLYPWVPARQINSAIKPFALCLFIKFKSCDLFSLQADNCWHLKVHNWAGPHFLSSCRDIFPVTQ